MGFSSMAWWRIINGCKNRGYIGSSNIEIVSNYFLRYPHVLSYFDLFILPCTPDEKQVRDTIATADDLIKCGVDSKKIVIIKNKVDPGAFDRNLDALDHSAAKNNVRVLSEQIVEQKLYQLLH